MDSEKPSFWSWLWSSLITFIKLQLNWNDLVQFFLIRLGMGDNTQRRVVHANDGSATDFETVDKLRVRTEFESLPDSNNRSQPVLPPANADGIYFRNQGSSCSGKTAGNIDIITKFGKK